jgi:hypothetical protein
MFEQLFLRFGRSSGRDRAAVRMTSAFTPAVAVGKAGVAQSGADSQYAPALHVLHERDLRESLHDAIIVHDDHRIVVADLGDCFDETRGQIELAALPIAGQVLRTLFDLAVTLDDTWARDADERRELESLVLRLCDELFEHLDEALHGVFTGWLVIGMTP